MEIIKKKICIEPFKSRIPSSLNVINQMNNTTSWGKIPYLTKVLNKEIKYGTMMDMYYTIVNTIVKSEYYQYSVKNLKWVKKNIDWRDILKSKENVYYKSDFPNKNEENYNFIIGITSIENVNCFYDFIKNDFGEEYNGFDFFENVNNILGREVIPYFYKCKKCNHKQIATNEKKCKQCNSEDVTEIQENNVPYFIYLSEVPSFIELMEELRENSTNNCCDYEKYQDYGGDIFYNYLLSLKDKEINNNNENNVIPTIDIPVLLTSKLYDSGVYRTYNVDFIENGLIENDSNIEDTDISNDNNIIRNNIVKSNITRVSGESKFKTLRKRKRSVDDNGNELPGIYNKETEKIEIPYQVGYIKNSNYNGVVNGNEIFYCDMIVKMDEFADIIETNKDEYDILIENLENNEYVEGTIQNPVEGITQTDTDVTKNLTINNLVTTEMAENIFKSELLDYEISLRKKLFSILKEKYPQRVFCLKQNYKFTCNINNGAQTKEKEGVFYVTYKNPQIEVTYVLGGTFRRIANKLFLYETNPFELNDMGLMKWDGNGIWYKETFPMKKFCKETFTIDEENKEIVYDIIDFKDKEITVNDNSVDFTIKNYILCDDIIYKSEAYKKNSFNDVVFKDEKMSGVNLPMKEKYNVVMDRGSSAAFERHLQLSELKTWEDLENYRNGMFLNK